MIGGVTGSSNSSCRKELWKKSKSRNLKILENDQRQAETWEEFTTEWLLLCLLGTFLLGRKYSFVAFKKFKTSA